MPRTRSPDLDALVQLDQQDLRIARLQREIRDLPDDLRAHQREVAKIEKEIDLVQQREKACKKEIDERALDTRSNTDQIGKYRVQQNQAKSNDEYSALKRQIEAIEAKNRDLEDLALERYMELDELKARAAELQKVLATAKKALAAEEKVVEGELDKVRAELAEVQAEREEQKRRVNRDILTLYERILAKAANGRALAGIEGGRCLGCHIEVPRERVGQAHDAQVIVSCPSCSRILFVE